MDAGKEVHHNETDEIKTIYDESIIPPAQRQKRRVLAITEELKQVQCI